MLIQDTLHSRWNPKHDNDARMAPAKFALEQVLTVVDALKKHKIDAAADKTLSPFGIQEKLRAALSTAEVGGKLYRTKKAIEVMRTKVEEHRARLLPPAPNASDAAAATLRSEMRTMLRNMDNGARISLLFDKNTDPRLWEAVLEAPNFTSGVTPEIRQQVQTAAIERLHPGAMARFDEIGESIALVDAAYRVTLYDARTMLGLPDTPSSLNQVVDLAEAALGDRARNIDIEVAGSFAQFADAEDA